MGSFSICTETDPMPLLDGRAEDSFFALRADYERSMGVPLLVINGHGLDSREYLKYAPASNQR
jgi:hypothetical protein